VSDQVKSEGSGGFRFIKVTMLQDVYAGEEEKKSDEQETLGSFQTTHLVSVSDVTHKYKNEQNKHLNKFRELEFLNIG